MIVATESLDRTEHSGHSIRSGILILSAALLAVGAVMAASSAASLDGRLLEGGLLHSLFGRQLVFVALGCCVLMVCSRMDPALLRWRPDTWRQPSLMLFLLTIGLLLMVWAPGIGVESHGRRRWIQLGLGQAGLSFQPSEFAKFSLVVLLAAILSRGDDRTVIGPRRFISAVAAIGVICALVGSEDFGTAVLLAAVGGLMLIVGGCRLSTLAAWTIPAVGAFAYLLMSHPYRVRRLLAFRHIWDDPQGQGYHAIQSLTAIASGGWTGRGLGAGVAKFGYLPEARTDFIFAIICEETGFVGGIAVILLFISLVWFGRRAMRRAGSADGGFHRLFAFGVTTTIGLQALMNIAVVTVMAPTKGIGLPLVSAGGSGVLCFALAMGLLAGGAVRNQAAATAQPAGAVGDPFQEIEPSDVRTAMSGATG